MAEQHPLTPPPELVEKWIPLQDGTSAPTLTTLVQRIADNAAQWGADQELEACCEWLRDEGWVGAMARLSAARRPKPPSLKEQALEARRSVWRSSGDSASWEILDRAIEALPDE